MQPVWSFLSCGPSVCSRKSAQSSNVALCGQLMRTGQRAHRPRVERHSEDWPPKTPIATPIRNYGQGPGFLAPCRLAGSDPHFGGLPTIRPGGSPNFQDALFGRRWRRKESRKQSGAGENDFRCRAFRYLLPYRDGTWLGPCCIGKAFRIAADRVNRDTRHCTPEEQVKSPHEIGAKPNPARHRHTQTQGKHAEENTRPQKLRGSLLCRLACS